MPEAAVHSGDVLSMIWSSGPVVKSVLALLIFLSVWTWAITISKILQLKRASRDTEEFTNIFWEVRNFARIDDSCRRLGASPLSTIFASGYKELTRILASGKETGKRAVPSEFELRAVSDVLKRAEYNESLKLESGTTFLATVASAAPFIGLFGTVWGIMTAFQGLGTAKTATIQAVAPGISEALVATAVGLAAAIPAAIAFNYFATAIKNFRITMDRFNEEFLNLANRYLSGVESF